MIKALLVTVVMTFQGEVVTLPDVVELESMEECERLSYQRDFQRPPVSWGAASFTYCVAL